MQIEQRAIESLIPYINNSRLHSEDQVSQIAASIREFGFNNPILVDGGNGIIAGHGRLMAARKLNMSEVPVIELSHLSEAQKKAYVIADNKIALNASWDESLLALELNELKDMDFDIGLTGFSMDELDQLMPSETNLPVLPDGDREPFQQITFTLHDSQVDSVNNALMLSKKMGEFTDTENENGNGNALARICEIFITQNADS